MQAIEQLSWVSATDGEIGHSSLCSVQIWAKIVGAVFQTEMIINIL